MLPGSGPGRPGGTLKPINQVYTPAKTAPISKSRSGLVTLLATLRNHLAPIATIQQLQPPLRGWRTRQNRLIQKEIVLQRHPGAPLPSPLQPASAQRSTQQLDQN